MEKTAAKPIIDRHTIGKWKPVIHKPTGKILIACQKQKSMIIDHYGNKYPFDECEIYPMWYGNRLQQCWERASAIAWDGCPLKVGDIVSPLYGKQAGQRFVVELFDHSDRTVGIANFQHWYPLEYLQISFED